MIGSTPDAPLPDRDPWSVSVAYGQFTAELLFDRTLPLAVEQHMVVTSIAYAFEGGWNLGASLGATIAGTLQGEDHALTFDPGFVGTIQAGVLFMEAGGGLPFIESTLSLSVSTSMLRSDVGETSPWTAMDLRLGATTGWRVYDIWVPYVAIRFFGGPVFWRDGQADRVGTDKHHYQVSVGSSLSLSGVELFVDWALPLGEAGLSGGLGYRF